MANSIAFKQNYANIIDRVYQKYLLLFLGHFRESSRAEPVTGVGSAYHSTHLNELLRR